MISFWVNQEGSFGIGNYRQNRGRAIADRFHTHAYDDIERIVRFPGGAQIFTALDQLTDCQREVVAAIWDAHTSAAPNARRLNDPRRVLLRFQLLTRLYEQGINTFRVFRATGLKDVNRFPVFVRHIQNHDGPLTRLLYARWEVARALCALRLRGFRLRDLMIVEFCDTSGSDRLFRKYSAFKVGNNIIACHVMVSHAWSVKSARNEPTEASIREGIEYIEENPHEDWLRQVFGVAGTDYGRADYGVLDGVPQVWEINLNPTLGRAEGRARHSSLAPDLKKLREDGRNAFHSRLRAAFLDLESESAEAEVDLTIDRALLARLQAEATASRRRLRVLAWLRGFYDEHRFSLPIRIVYSRLFPRR